MTLTIDETSLISRARARGYDLVQRETDTGQIVWTWPLGGDARQPQFLSRRQAFVYMEDRLRSIAAFDGPPGA